MTVGKVLFPIKKKTNENFHLKNAWKFALKNIGQVFYFDFFLFFIKIISISVIHV